MLLLLSPAKTLDYDTPATIEQYTQPQFKAQAAELVSLLSVQTPAEIASLMKISDHLAVLNVARFQAWSTRFTTKNSKQAILTFDGDVYTGLDANSLKEEDLLWGQDHLVILSGLYGMLRPLDLLQAYRLEMGIKLVNGKGKDLYAFWQDLIAPELNKRLQQDKTPVIINLASQEYFKAVDLKQLKARVVECVFEDFNHKSGKFQIITFYAKRARGLMARYVIQNRLQTPQALRAFDVDGYAYHEASSSPDRLVFRRTLVGA